MADGIDIQGWDDLENYLDSIEIDEKTENKALGEAGRWLIDKVRDYIENEVEDIGVTRKHTKGRISRLNGEKVYRIFIDSADILYVNYGSSKNMEHVNFFENIIDDNQGELLEKVTKVIEEVVMK